MTKIFTFLADALSVVATFRHLTPHPSTYGPSWMCCCVQEMFVRIMIQRLNPEWPDFFCWDQILMIWFFTILMVLFFCQLFLVHLVFSGFFKIWCFWLFFYAKMEMSSSKCKIWQMVFWGHKKSDNPDNISCIAAAIQSACVQCTVHGLSWKFKPREALTRCHLKI